MEWINDRLASWATDLDEATIEQAARTARMDIVEGHVSLMPDAHLGYGATIGSVIPTRDAVIPYAVGVDIGCGMIATRTSLNAADLPDNLDKFLPIVEKAVPAGMGKGHEDATNYANEWFAKYGQAPGVDSGFLDDDLMKTAQKQFGSLGSGNHFFEICLDEQDRVWIVLHSGSRGVGNKIATAHIDKCKKMAKDMELALEDPNLAYFTQEQPEFQAYINDMLWAQEYAMGNRQAMNLAVLKEFFSFVGAGEIEDRINCHHNFTQYEIHDGEGLWITRKGAIQADDGVRGVIPGSMGARSYVVEGLGNPESWNSCSHGAGRTMSRKKAKKEISVEQFTASMEGKHWLSNRAEELLDESPMAYKDIDQVMANQADLVKATDILSQILNYKGV